MSCYYFLIHPHIENFRVVDYSEDTDTQSGYGWEFLTFENTTLEDRHLKKGEFFDISRELAKATLSKRTWKFWKLYRRRMQYQFKAQSEEKKES